MERIVQALTGEQVAEALRNHVLALHGVDPKTRVAMTVSYAVQDGAVAAAAVVLDPAAAVPPIRKNEDPTP